MPDYDYYRGRRHQFATACKGLGLRQLVRDRDKYRKFAALSSLSSPARAFMRGEEAELKGMASSMTGLEFLRELNFRGLMGTKAIIALEEEWMHYELSNKVILIDGETCESMADQRNKVILSDIEYPAPTFEIATQLGFGYSPMLVALHSDLWLKAMNIPSSWGGGVWIHWVGSGLQETVLLPMGIELGDVLDQLDPTCHGQVAIAYNLLIHLHLNKGVLPVGKAHGRPAIGASAPSVHSLFGMAGHFRTSFVRTLRDRCYYRGQPYPPEKWRITEVKATFVGKRDDPANPRRNEIMSVEATPSGATIKVAPRHLP